MCAQIPSCEGLGSKGFRPVYPKSQAMQRFWEPPVSCEGWIRSSIPVDISISRHLKAGAQMCADRRRDGQKNLASIRVLRNFGRSVLGVISPREVILIDTVRLKKMKMMCKTLLVYITLSMPFGVLCVAEAQDSTQPKREAAWMGGWSPAASQMFRITEDFALSFSDDFPLSYLRGKHFELRLQDEDGFIGTEGIVEKRRLMFLIFADDEDQDKAWLVINRIDKIEGKRTEKVLLKTFFRRVPNGSNSSPIEN